jgi:nucleoside-diphosphate-sugar epimerase
MRVLVTGATGFTGHALCQRLARDGQTVVAFIRQPAKAARLRQMGVDCRIVDIQSQEEVQRHISGIKKIFHIAAAYRSEHADRDEFRLVNVEATRILLEAAKRNGIERFIHCSTVGVQGHIATPPANEEYRCAPGDHYQQSKLEAELLAREYFSQGLPGVVVRPVGIYGPGDTRFLKLFRSINRRRFLMIGTGNTLYHMTFIDDLVDGFMLAGDRHEALGEVFTIAGPRYTTIRELVDTIAKALGKSVPRIRIPLGPVYVAAVVCDVMCRSLHVEPPLYPRRVEFFRLDRAFSIDKARRMLGYAPNVDLPDGIKRSVLWYKQQSLL